MSGRGISRGSTWREANAKGPPRRMEVAIPHNNLRVFAAAVQCLMKVGKELFIEATVDQLILRTLNDAKSAFAAFYFNDSGGFFESFRCEASRTNEDRPQGQESDTQASSATAGSGTGSVSCKVQVRAVHGILRTLKKVVRLVVYVEDEDDDNIEPHLVFQMYCEYGYRKVHRFSLQDCEIMHAVFEGEGASRLSCPPVQLCQLLEHIHGTAEVAMGASHDVLNVRSFHHPLTGSAERAVLKTEMSISTAEFDTYSFCGADDEEVELVFSLKEIKALLHFCESTEAQTLEILFREGGDPILFQSHSNTFAGELIMATMEPKIVCNEPRRQSSGGGEGTRGSRTVRDRGSSRRTNEIDRDHEELRNDRRDQQARAREDREADDQSDHGVSQQRQEQPQQQQRWTSRNVSGAHSEDNGRRQHDDEHGSKNVRGYREADEEKEIHNERGQSHAKRRPRTPASESYNHQEGSADDRFGSGENDEDYAMIVDGRRRPSSESTRDNQQSRASSASAEPPEGKRQRQEQQRRRRHPSRCDRDGYDGDGDGDGDGGNNDNYGRAAGRHESEPQSEMPTQFPGLRAAVDSTEDSVELLEPRRTGAEGRGGSHDRDGPDGEMGTGGDQSRQEAPLKRAEDQQRLRHSRSDEDTEDDEDDGPVAAAGGKRKRRVLPDDEDEGPDLRRVM